MSKPKYLYKYHVVGFRIIPKPNSLAYKIRQTEVNTQKKPTPQNRLTMEIAIFDVPDYNGTKRRSGDEIQELLESIEKQAWKFIESKECEKYRHFQSGEINLTVSPIQKRVKIRIG